MNLGARIGCWSKTSGVRRVQSIVSNLNQVVGLGFTATNDTEISLDLIPLNDTVWGVFIGNYFTDSPYKAMTIANTNSRHVFTPLMKTNAQWIGMPYVNYSFGERYLLVGRAGYLKVGNVSEITYDIGDYNVISEEMCLFGVNNGTYLTSRRTAAEVFSASLKKSGYEANFIPVVKDGVAYMFDENNPTSGVNGDGLFGNNYGTGTLGWRELDGTLIPAT